MLENVCTCAVAHIFSSENVRETDLVALLFLWILPVTVPAPRAVAVDTHGRLNPICIEE